MLLEEVCGFLGEIPESSTLRLFDGTLGGGGYTSRFLQQGWQVFACDLDVAAIANFRATSQCAASCTLKQANFANYIQEFPDSFFDGIVLDLGFSSNQLAFGRRGFSYQSTQDPFDLRYDTSSGQPVWQKILQLPNAYALQKILYGYSGETLSQPLASALYQLLQQKRSCLTVAAVVAGLTGAIPARFRHRRNAILSRIWQALRIWTNSELESLKLFLNLAPSKLRPGGRLAIVCFHSLEDKIVTHTMRQLARPQVVDDFGNKLQTFQLLTRKAIVPSAAEVATNRRSRSARLRVLERCQS